MGFSFREASTDSPMVSESPSLDLGGVVMHGVVGRKDRFRDTGSVSRTMPPHAPHYLIVFPAIWR